MNFIIYHTLISNLPLKLQYHVKAFFHTLLSYFRRISYSLRLSIAFLIILLFLHCSAYVVCFMRFLFSLIIAVVMKREYVLGTERPFLQYRLVAPVLAG